jgi:hypothetical protein
MNEFCPKCGLPLSTEGESDRLCFTCGWFGDRSETLTTQPEISDITRNVVALLSEYRTMCRAELQCEEAAVVIQNPVLLAQVEQNSKLVHDATTNIVNLMLTLYEI